MDIDGGGIYSLFIYLLLTMICQSLRPAAIYAAIYSIYVLSIAVTTLDGVEDPPPNISDCIRIVDLLLPNLVRSDQKIDPILKLFIEGFLPYYISSIGQNLYTCLIPDIRGDDPIMDKFRRYIVTTVDALDNDGPDEDTGGVLLKETAETAP